MKRNLLFGVVTLLAGAVLAADGPKDEVLAAAKKLASQSNYSWKSTMDLGANSQFTPGPTEGKTEKDGLTWLSTSFNDNTSEGIMKGTKVAVKGESGWQTAEEAAGDGGGGFNPGTMVLRRLQGLKVPADEVQDLVAKSKELKKEGDVYSGELTEDGAKALLAGGFGGRRGGTPPTVSNAKGTAKFWLKDGALAKYEIKVSGKRQNQNGEDVDREVNTTVEIKDVGTTKLNVPEEAKKKVS